MYEKEGKETYQFRGLAFKALCTHQKKVKVTDCL